MLLSRLSKKAETAANAKRLHQHADHRAFYDYQPRTDWRLSVMETQTTRPLLSLKKRLTVLTTSLILLLVPDR